MNVIAKMNLKTRAVFATGAILLLVLTFNTAVNVYTSTSRYQDALIARTAAMADDARKDIMKATGFGLPLNALEGMSDKLRALAEEDKDISRAMVMDLDGRVLYASDRSFENRTLTDKASRKAVTSRTAFVQSYSDEAGGHLEKVIPLTGPDNKQLGVFRIALKGSAVNRQVRSLLLWSLLVAFLSFIAATILVVLFFDRSISRPITEQAAIAGSMAAEIFHARSWCTGRPRSMPSAPRSTPCPQTSGPCSAR